MQANFTQFSSPRMRVLSEEQIQELHFAACEILMRTGMKIGSEKAINLLHSHGAYVAPSKIVRIPSHLVDKALHTAPKSITLCNRAGERKIFLESGKVFFGANPDNPTYIDPYTHERRQWVSNDAKHIGLILDYCQNIDFVLTQFHAFDYPMDVGDRVMVRQMMLHCTKTIGFNCKDINSLQDIMEMGAIIAGGHKELEQNPYMFHIQEPISPLCHDTNGIEEVMLCAKRRFPIVYYSIPMGGATAPATAAGRLALTIAESLTGLVVHQLTNPGAPFVFGGIPSVMDMKTARMCYSAPELYLHCAALTDVAHYYNLPMWGTAGMTDAKQVDPQCGADMALSILMAALSGGNLVHDVGYMDQASLCCPEGFILADEIIGIVKHIMKGIDINKETLALDVIDKVGHGGHFLAEEHTLAHFRDFWMPAQFDRSVYRKENTLPSMNERLNKKARYIIENYQVPPLPEEKLQELLELEKRWLS